MLAIPMGAQAITLNPAGGRFDTNLPARLAGIIGPDEFAASINRCNAAYTAGPLWLARMVLVGGFLAWGICFGVAFSSQDNYNGPSMTLIFIGIGIMAACSILGGIWIRAIVSQRIQGLRDAVSAEHNYYNSVARAQARGQGPPISWTMIATTLFSYGYRRSRWATMCQIQIEVGGGAAFVQPVVMMQQAPGQPPMQPYYQSYQAQAAYNPAAAAPVYPGAPQAFPQASQAYVAPGEENARSPLLANAHGASETAEGEVHPVAAPVQIATCQQCGRTSANPQDRFCPGCGGAFRR